MRWWVLVLCVWSAWPAYGQEGAALALLPPIETPGESLGEILERLERLELENAELRARVDAVATRDAAGSALSADALSASSAPVVTADWNVSAGDADAAVATCACHQPGCPHCNPAAAAAGDDYPTLAWGGFLQLDSGWVSQDDANKLAVGDIEAQTGLRRVRLRASGRVRADISYVVDFDFAASGHPSFRDIKFTLEDRPIIDNLVIGYFQQPFGLDAMSSGRDLVLLERQLPFAFAPFRQTGLMSHRTALDGAIRFAHSVYTYPTDSFGVSEGDRSGWAYAARLTAILWDDPAAAALWQVGGSYSFQDPGTNIVRYSIEPGFFVTDPTATATNGEVPVFVDTGDIATQNVNLGGVETIGLWGPLSLQMEATTSLVNPDVGPQLGFGAASAKLGYVLTGESHAFRRRRGVVGGVTPRIETTSLFDFRGGAWEATAAWAWIDLDDGAVAGGEMQTVIVGVNRYLTSFAKLQFNVVRALLDEPVAGNSAATVAAVRAQVEF